MNSELKPKERFTNRAKNYAKYRPTYSTEIIEYLQSNSDMKKEDIIADIGSGTGISSKLFLENGNTVYSVEPNSNMRSEAEEQLKSYSNFNSVDGSAENTLLENQSVNYIISAQAFHWFEPDPTKKEFERILKDDGKVILLWNRRNIKNEGFMRELVKIIEKYKATFTLNGNAKDTIKDFFGINNVTYEVFENNQKANYERVLGELSSFSYLPNEGDMNYDKLVSDVSIIFGKYKNGSNEVVLSYETQLYIGKI